MYRREEGERGQSISIRDIIISRVNATEQPYYYSGYVIIRVRHVHNITCATYSVMIWVGEVRVRVVAQYWFYKNVWACDRGLYYKYGIVWWNWGSASLDHMSIIHRLCAWVEYVRYNIMSFYIFNWYTRYLPRYRISRRSFRI